MHFSKKSLFFNNLCDSRTNREQYKIKKEASSFEAPKFERELIRKHLLLFLLLLLLLQKFQFQHQHQHLSWYINP